MSAAEGRSWTADVRARLLERRTVLLRGDLDDDLAGLVVAELMMLDRGEDPIVLHVDSAGGPLHAAFGVVDTIDSLGVAVHAVCLGRAEGSAVMVVASASDRRAARHARFRLHEPASSVEGSAADVEAWSARHAADVALMVARLAQSTHRPVEHLEADIAAGRWLDAQQAVAYGLADGIWERGR